MKRHWFFRGRIPVRLLHLFIKSWQRVHLLTAEEAHRFMGNGIVVNGSYITPCVTPPLEAILHQEGLNPVIVETTEFEKAGGSCFCMKTFLP
jgi:N-dimethylarginine dimethylaminohydrolase